MYANLEGGHIGRPFIMMHEYFIYFLETFFTLQIPAAESADFCEILYHTLKPILNVNLPVQLGILLMHRE